MKHEELGWIPMRTEKGRSWFFQAGIRDLRRAAKEDFVKYCCVEWKVLHKEGWRIVRVRLSYHQ